MKVINPPKQKTVHAGNEGEIENLEKAQLNTLAVSTLLACLALLCHHMEHIKEIQGIMNLSRTFLMSLLIIPAGLSVIHTISLLVLSCVQQDDSGTM